MREMHQAGWHEETDLQAKRRLKWINMKFLRLLAKEKRNVISERADDDEGTVRTEQLSREHT